MSASTDGIGSPLATTVEELTETENRTNADPMSKPPAVIGRDSFALLIGIREGDPQLVDALTAAFTKRFRFIRRQPDVLQGHVDALVEVLRDFHQEDPLDFASRIILQEVQSRLDEGQTWEEASEAINGFMGSLLVLRDKSLS